MLPESQPLTRRRALKQILFFSAALALPAQVRRALAAPVTGERHFLMIGDFGRAKDPEQGLVAAAMKQYVGALKIRPDGLFLLGDNFYGSFKGGVNSPRWQSGFEEMYPADVFPGPCWATLGNHDYDEEAGLKMAAQLSYASAHPGTRWTMPAKWHRFDWPAQNPLFTCLSLDSNYKNNYVSLSPKEREKQLAWLKAELARPQTAPWRFCLGHHPLYSNGQHGDHPHLIEDWGPLFQEHAVPFYFAGHDHDLQHLEFEGLKTSFVISGGGGARVRELKKPGRGPFSKAAYGFTHLQISPERFVVRHIDPTQRELHAFARTLDGRVEILA